MLRHLLDLPLSLKLQSLVVVTLLALILVVGISAWQERARMLDDRITEIRVLTEAGVGLPSSSSRRRKRASSPMRKRGSASTTRSAHCAMTVAIISSSTPPTARSA